MCEQDVLRYGEEAKEWWMHGDGWLCVSMEEQPCGLIWLVYFLLLRPLDLSVVLCVGFLFYNMHERLACLCGSISWICRACMQPQGIDP